MSDLSESITESITGGTSEVIQQEGGSTEIYMMMALGISCCTIYLTSVILICIINKKSNC